MFQSLILKSIKLNKTVPNEKKKFVLDTGEQIIYSVLHKEDQNTTHNNCYPVIAQLHGEKKRNL